MHQFRAILGTNEFLELEAHRIGVADDRRRLIFEMRYPEVFDDFANASCEGTIHYRVAELARNHLLATEVAREMIDSGRVRLAYEERVLGRSYIPNQHDGYAEDACLTEFNDRVLERIADWPKRSRCQRIAITALSPLDVSVPVIRYALMELLPRGDEHLAASALVEPISYKIVCRLFASDRGLLQSLKDSD